MQLQSSLNPDVALLVMIGDAVRENALGEVLTLDSWHSLSTIANRLLPDLKAGELEVVRLGQRNVALAALPTNAADARKLGIAAARLAQKLKARSIGVMGLGAELASEMALGVQLGAYRFTRYKPEESPAIEQLSMDNLATSEAQRVSALASGVQLARDLVNTPYNDLPATAFAEVARKVAQEGHLEIEVWGQAECQQRGMGLFVAVGQGSAHEPQFIKLTYRPKGNGDGAPRRITALVGKGVMFDTGGYSLKSAGGMYGMKGDMGGAAAVLGAMQIVATLRPQHEVRAYIAATDNAVSGTAMRPGDIYRALNGQQVEVTNTDAEGRLVLADALTLASQEGADEIIDIATLTGAKVTALGDDVAALFSDDPALTQAL